MNNNNNNVEFSVKEEYDITMEDPKIKTFNNFKKSVINTIQKRKQEDPEMHKTLTYNDAVLKKYWEKYGQFKVKQGGKRSTRKASKKTRKGRKQSKRKGTYRKRR